MHNFPLLCGNQKTMYPGTLKLNIRSGEFQIDGSFGIMLPLCIIVQGENLQRMESPAEVSLFTGAGGYLF